MSNVNEQGIELKRFSTVGFKRLTGTALLPTKAHPTDSGFDLCADEQVIIKPGQTVVIKTGIAVVLPQGYEATVRPRSGITSRTKLRVQLGTIDNGFTGNIGIIVDNIAHLGDFEDRGLIDITGYVYHSGKSTPGNTYIIHKGDKLAQLCVNPIATFAGVEITELDDTDRGTAGYGSTGV